MVRVGVIGSFDFFKDLERKTIKTDYGPVDYFQQGKAFFILRHAKDVPPHRVSYRANISAMMKLKVDALIGLYSAGSLQKRIDPGSIVVPDDFLQLSEIITFFDTKIVHATPTIEPELRKNILEACKGSKVVDGGTYVSVKGPRLETKAEVQFYRGLGDVIGMTLGSEATLACEMGIPFAAICSADNYAHGLTGEKLDNDDIFAMKEQNKAKMQNIVMTLLKGMGAIQ